MTTREFFRSVSESVQLVCGDPLAIRAFVVVMVFGAIALIGRVAGVFPIHFH